jgi:serine protease Do
VYQRTVKALQFSAIVNNGNSGGPLVNKYGQVVGVISMKSSSSYAGIGFAFPIDESMEIINEIIKNGNADGIDSPLSIERPMLGITAVGVTANKWYIITDNGTKQIKEDELENYPDAFKAGHTGVLITEVSAGTGAYGKLQKNDIILKINGQSVINVATISYVLVNAKAGDTAEVDFARGDKIMSAKIVLS